MYKELLRMPTCQKERKYIRISDIEQYKSSDYELPLNEDNIFILAFINFDRNEAC